MEHVCLAVQQLAAVLQCTLPLLILCLEKTAAALCILMYWILTITEPGPEELGAR